MNSEKRVNLALVLTVFRGALLKGKDGKDKATRKLRISKPSVYALPVQSISKCRVLHLTETGSLKYFACALSPCELLCPTTRILGHLPSATCQMSETKIRVSISEAAQKQMQALQEKPELLAAVPSGAITDASVENGINEFESEQQTYSASDFTASIAGSQKIVAFLKSLPKQWSNKGVPIVDEKNMVNVQGTDHPWHHICLRAPEFLDNVYSGPSKGYGKIRYWPAYADHSHRGPSRSEKTLEGDAAQAGGQQPASAHASAGNCRHVKLCTVGSEAGGTLKLV